jgi:hypothetical protein
MNEAFGELRGAEQFSFVNQNPPEVPLVQGGDDACGYLQPENAVRFQHKISQTPPIVASASSS